MTKQEFDWKPAEGWTVFAEYHASDEDYSWNMMCLAYDHAGRLGLLHKGGCSCDYVSDYNGDVPDVVGYDNIMVYFREMADYERSGWEHLDTVKRRLRDKERELKATRVEKHTITEWAAIDGNTMLDPDGFDRKDPNLSTNLYTREEWDAGWPRCTMAFGKNFLEKMRDA